VHRRRDAVGRLEEREGQAGLQVGAAAAGGSTPPTLSEQAPEQVAQVERDATRPTEATGGTFAHAAHRTHCPDLVVLDPPGLVA